MIVNNTTNIPDKLVAIAVAFAIEEIAGIEIDEIVIKNKKEGKIGGQWGWYWHHNRKVVLIVPREIKTPFRAVRTYTRKIHVIRNRTDFLVSIMAHELRHAWQYQTNGEKWKPLAMKVPREMDAEHYEGLVLAKWQMFTQETQLKCAASQKEI